MGEYEHILGMAHITQWQKQPHHMTLFMSWGNMDMLIFPQMCAHNPQKTGISEYVEASHYEIKTDCTK